MKRKKYNFITPDYSENNLVFNHNLNGSLVEENTNDILDSVIEYFGKDDKFRPGACYILPNGSFINVDHHGDVDEFIINNYDIEPEQFLNTYLVDFENCVRCNDGRGKSFTLDRYITLPKTITNDQIYSIEHWLKKYPNEEISISSVDGQVVTFNLICDGISYVINRIKRYKNSNILVEEKSKDLFETTKQKKIKNAMFGDKRHQIISFGIITAENPMSQALDDLENIQRNNKLKADFKRSRLRSPLYKEIIDLRNEGHSKKEISDIIRNKLRDREERNLTMGMLQYIPLEGFFNNLEHSFFVLNVSLNEMINFASTYIQRSFWYGETTNDYDNVNISYYERTNDISEYKKVFTSTVIYDAKELDNYFSKVGNMKFHIFSDYFGDNEEMFKDIKQIKNEEAAKNSIFGNLTGYGLLRERMKAYNEDIEETELPDLSDENIISQEDAGINSLFIDLINDCWSIIDNYHSIIVTLDSLGRHEFDETLKGLLEDRNKEVGSLQGILEILSPSSSQIELGKSEAEDQVAFDEVHEDFGISEPEYYSRYVTTKESFNKLTEEDERDLYLKAGLDPDIDRTPGTRDDGTYYDDKGFHWASDGHLLAEVNSKGAVIVPKDWEEWWT